MESQRYCYRWPGHILTLFCTLLFGDLPMEQMAAPCVSPLSLVLRASRETLR